MQWTAILSILLSGYSIGSFSFNAVNLILTGSLQMRFVCDDVGSNTSDIVVVVSGVDTRI
jgi:hypothetical protein